MPFVLTESAQAALGGANDAFGLSENTGIIALIVRAGDSAGLIEAAQVPTGNAITSSDAFTVVEPTPVNIGITETETESLAEVGLGGLAVSQTDLVGMLEVATNATKSANAITDTDTALLGEARSSTVALSTAEATAVAEAIANLLNSLTDTDAAVLAELGSPSFGGISYVGAALALADLLPAAVGETDLEPAWDGEGDLF